MIPKTAEEWAFALALIPHPEGGWYRETWRSNESIPHSSLPGGFKGDRSAGTCIYFLLRGGFPSHLHRIASDEIWHWYQGAPISVHVLREDGSYRELSIGPDPSAGQSFQAVVPAGAWFGAESRGDWSLCGCTVSPGFDFADFELAERSAMVSKFPGLRDLVERLT